MAIVTAVVIRCRGGFTVAMDGASRLYPHRYLTNRACRGRDARPPPAAARSSLQRCGLASPTHPPQRRPPKKKIQGKRRPSKDAVRAAGGAARRGRAPVVVGGRHAGGRRQRHGVPVHGPAVRPTLPRPGDAADAVPLLPAAAGGGGALPLGAAAAGGAEVGVGVPSGRGVPRGGRGGEPR
ncbi:hypothetical protein ACQJBY_020289 [Aegilops geniculata]